MKGSTKSPPRVSGTEVLLAWLGSFVGIAAVAFISEKVVQASGVVLVIGSFGASAVLIYGAIKSPLAQPRNLVGGHLLSAVIGVAAFKLFHGIPWLAASIGVATAIAVMHVTKTLHPPGGATALIAVVGGDAIHSLGFTYVLVPVGAGVAIMLLVALIFNNIPKHRRYPEFWW
ncbi:MAG: HPP family protein [Desulfomonile sp.]|nr:HPP family protein [Desulfomonile sp.]